nr:uncharacterized protein LOC118968130 [Manis javanica]
MAPSPPFSSRRRLLLLLTSPRPRALRAPSARPSPRPPLQPASPGRGVRREPGARARAATGGWMDGASENASVRARAPLPLPPRGREANRERAPTSSSSSSRPPQHPAPALPSSSFFRFRAPSDCSRLLEGPERVHLPRGRSSAAFAPGGGDRAGRRGATPPSKVPADGDEGGEMGEAFRSYLGQSLSSLGLAGPIGWQWAERRSSTHTCWPSFFWNPRWTLCPSACLPGTDQTLPRPSAAPLAVPMSVRSHSATSPSGRKVLSQPQ